MHEEPVIHERPVRAALRRSLLSEPFLASRYSFSPYMACGHGCLYCDGRAERYWVEGVFERDIVVRTNIVPTLDAELRRCASAPPCPWAPASATPTSPWRRGPGSCAKRAADDELHLLLCHMVVLYGGRGSDTTRLRAGLERYRGWLVERKRQFNRRRRQTSEQIEGELGGMLAGSGMRDFWAMTGSPGFCAPWAWSAASSTIRA